MDSGGLTPTHPVDCAKGQAIFHRVVNAAGCTQVADKLACLLALPYEKFLEATQTVPTIFSYGSVALSYLPRPDGKTLTKSLEVFAGTGACAQVPSIIGDQEDDGSLFSFVTPHVTTTEKLVDYLSEF
jgi:carboxylesterase type B